MTTDPDQLVPTVDRAKTSQLCEVAVVLRQPAHLAPPGVACLPSTSRSLVVGILDIDRRPCTGDLVRLCIDRLDSTDSALVPTHGCSSSDPGQLGVVISIVGTDPDRPISRMLDLVEVLWSDGTCGCCSTNVLRVVRVDCCDVPELRELVERHQGRDE